MTCQKLREGSPEHQKDFEIWKLEGKSELTQHAQAIHAGIQLSGEEIREEALVAAKGLFDKKVRPMEAKIYNRIGEFTASLDYLVEEVRKCNLGQKDLKMSLEEAVQNMDTISAIQATMNTDELSQQIKYCDLKISDVLLRIHISERHSAECVSDCADFNLKLREYRKLVDSVSYWISTTGIFLD